MTNKSKYCSQLTDKEKNRIVKLHIRDNQPISSIARRFRVGLDTVSKIILEAGYPVTKYKKGGDVIQSIVRPSFESLAEEFPPLLASSVD